MSVQNIRGVHVAGMSGTGDMDGGEPVPALALGHSLAWGRYGNAPAAWPLPRLCRPPGAAGGSRPRGLQEDAGGEAGRPVPEKSGCPEAKALWQVRGPAGPQPRPGRQAEERAGCGSPAGSGTADCAGRKATLRSSRGVGSGITAVLAAGADGAERPSA